MSDHQVLVSKQIRVNGIVQGVGFRPFVYQLALAHRIKGSVANTSEGVIIHALGTKNDVDLFYRKLEENHPPLAMITELGMEDYSGKPATSFGIIKSDKNKNCATLISPDVSICEDCLAELRDKGDRRYHYPFINCTNCGPRYSIITDIPYDRPKTSMSKFRLCGDCSEEYQNPLNRRFHAQPNCCSVCGPDVGLYDHQKKSIECAGLFKETADLLKKGKIVAVKGLGGFHLAVDAFNDAAVKKLRNLKNRGDKPFAVMAADTDSLEAYVCMNAAEKKYLRAYQKPVVVLQKKKETGKLSPHIAPGNSFIGVMLAYTPLHYLLFDAGADMLVMTSGNRKNEPIAIDNDEAFERLGGIADYFLIHDRDIYVRSDDSVIKQKDKNSDDFILFRRARGFVPMPVLLKKHYPEILATGGELKNTVCFLKENTAFVSQHIGDLQNSLASGFFEETIGHMKKILETNPGIIACDLHPDYVSSRFAEASEAFHTKIQVQHHHAHIVSCMAENGVEGPVIGLAFDGTGYGTDGNIWGGEVFTATCGEFSRKAHLAYMPMPGGDAAAKEPWRMGISYLYDALGMAMMGRDIPMLASAFQQGVTKISGPEKVAFLIRMIDKKVNCPLTSSMGRLFDAVASITGLCHINTFDGQAAARLEMAAKKEAEGVYPYPDIESFLTGEGLLVINCRQIIRGIADDIENQVNVGLISRKFHRTVSRLFTEVCTRLRSETGINTVAMSGGVFQNITLSAMLESDLKKEGFEVCFHKQLPPNDGGLSLGQAVIAAERVNQGEKCH